MAKRGDKYFHGELDVNSSLTASFDSIVWFGSEELYKYDLDKKRWYNVYKSIRG